MSNPYMKFQNYTLNDLNGRTDEQAGTSMPPQLLQKLGA